jgi:hypothetical protein
VEHPAPPRPRHPRRAQTTRPASTGTEQANRSEVSRARRGNPTPALPTRRAPPAEPADTCHARNRASGCDRFCVSAAAERTAPMATSRNRGEDALLAPDEQADVRAEAAFRRRCTRGLGLPPDDERDRQVGSGPRRPVTPIRVTADWWPLHSELGSASTDAARRIICLQLGRSRLAPGVSGWSLRRCSPDSGHAPRCAFVAISTSLVKAGATPAFLRAGVFAADGAGAAAYVRKEQRGDRRRDCSVTDGAVHRGGRRSSQLVRGRSQLG